MGAPGEPPPASACPVISTQPPLPAAGSLEPRVEVLINRINEVQQGELRDLGLSARTSNVIHRAQYKMKTQDPLSKNYGVVHHSNNRALHQARVHRSVTAISNHVSIHLALLPTEPNERASESVICCLVKAGSL